ncbi:hypothetical protein JCM19379_07580 [Methyloparacoccus murrellii]
MLDILLLEQGIVDVEHGAAGIAENVLHPLVLQTPDNDFSAAELHELHPAIKIQGAGSRPERIKRLTNLLGLDYTVKADEATADPDDAAGDDQARVTGMPHFCCRQR